MKKQTLIGFVLSFIIIMTTSLFSVYAVGEASFSIPDGAVSTGKEFSVSITFSATDNIGNVQTQIAYDNSILQFVGGDSITGSNGILTLNGSASNEKSATYSITFMGLKEGTASLNLVNCSILSSSGSPIGSPTAYANITVAGETVGTVVTTTQATETAKTESSAVTTETTTTAVTAAGSPTQGVLSNLTVDNGTLQPSFSYDVLNYTVNVDYSVDNVEIEGTTASPTDYIWYTGDSACQVGNNVRTITVTDTNGIETTYTITIIRAEQGETVSQQAGEESQKDTISKSDMSSQTVSKEDSLATYKSVLNPALIIVLIVLVVSLVIIIVWMKNRVFGKKNKK